MFSVLMSFLLLNDLCIIQLDAKTRLHQLFNHNNNIQPNEAYDSIFKDVDYSLSNNFLDNADIGSVVAQVNTPIQASAHDHLQHQQMLHFDFPVTATGIPQLSTQQLQSIADVLPLEISSLSRVLTILTQRNKNTRCMKPELLMKQVVKELNSAAVSTSGPWRGSINSVFDSADDDRNAKEADGIDELTADLEVEPSNSPVATVNDGAMGWAIIGGVVIVVLAAFVCFADMKRDEGIFTSSPVGGILSFNRGPEQVSNTHIEAYQSPESFRIQSGKVTPTRSPRQQQSIVPLEKESPNRLSHSESQRYLLSSFNSRPETSRLGAAASEQAQCHVTIDVPADRIKQIAELSVDHYYKQESNHSVDQEEKQKIVETVMKVVDRVRQS